MRTPALSASLLILLLATAHADERPDIARATSAVATTREALRAWAKSQPGDVPLAKTILEREGALVLSPPNRSMPGQGAAERELVLLASQLATIRDDLARHAEELALGSAVGPRAAPALSSETIDARGLIDRTPDFPRPWPGLPDRVFVRPGAGAGGFAGGVIFGDDNQHCTTLGIDGDKLRDLLDPICSGARMDGGVLTLKGTAAELRAARREVALLRSRLTPAHITLDVRAYVLTRAEWVSLEREGLLLGPEGERRLEAVASSGRARLIGRQVLATVDGQLSGLDLGELHVMALPADTSAVGTIASVQYRTGLAVETLPRLSHDRRSVLLNARIRFAEPRASSRAQIAGVSVSLPELGYARTQSATRIPLGRTAALAGTFSSPGGADDAVGCLVFVTPHLTERSAEARPEPEPPSPPPSAADAPRASLLTTASRDVARVEALARQVDEAVTLAATQRTSDPGSSMSAICSLRATNTPDRAWASPPPRASRTTARAGGASTRTGSRR